MIAACMAKSASNPAPYSTVELQIVGIRRGRGEVSSASGNIEALGPARGERHKEVKKWRDAMSTIDCDGRCISSVGEDGCVTKIWMSREVDCILFQHPFHPDCMYPAHSR